MLLKETGVLIHGVDIDGEIQRKFEMREATIRDGINALDKMMVAKENLDSGYTVLIYKAAEQMISLGVLPKSDITGQLLLSLPEEDFDAILKVQDELTKKRSDTKVPGVTSPS